MFKHPGMYALAVAAMCFVALNLVDDGGGAAVTSGAATGGGSAGRRTKSPFDVVARAAAAPRTQVMNLSPDASLEDLSKPREDAMRVAVKATNTDGDDEEAEGDASAKKDGEMPPPALPKGDRERLSILARARPEDVRLEPYPYIVVKDALHPTTYAQLSASYPKYKDVVRVAKGKGRNVAPNTRVDIRASMLGEASGVLTPLWKEFVEYHTSRAFYLEVLDLFEDAIRANHGYLEHAPDGVKRSLHDLTTRVRLTKEAKPGKCDVAMDAQIGVNTPVKGKPAPVRGPHIDNVHEIYAALLYMRDERDPATGGALEVYRCTKPAKSGGKRGKAGGVNNKEDGCKEYSADERASRRAKVGYDVQFDPATLETVATVPYEANTLAMFINSKTSYHGVTPRSASGYSRRLVNVIGEIPFVSTFVKSSKKG